MNKFTLGAVTGATSLLLTVPIFAQMAGAQSVSSAATAATKTRPVPTQTCVLAMADHETAMLNTIDANTAARKSAATAKRDALKAASALTDDTARMEAVKKAQEAFRTAMQSTMKPHDEVAMAALKAACGDSFRGMGGLGGVGDMKGKMTEKFGMTEQELKAAIDSGKSIEQIAAEKGISLPAHKKGGNGKGMMKFMR
ncbi:MAG: hypothetical protein KBC47_01080 [Candidatus Peribacteraceae bacterium]|nr:hypothetical protein [Candidatus Peribacteraceae bacterium]